MQSIFLKITSIVLLSGIFLSLPLSGLAKSDAQFPYHINKTVEKEKVFDYSFETIWETALILIKEMEATRLIDLNKEKMQSLKSSIKSDKDSGIISFRLTHKGNKGIFTDDKSLFYYQVLLLKSLGEKRTRVYFHEINFYSYDSYPFRGKQLARYVEFTPSAINILEAINTKLRENSLENK